MNCDETRRHWHLYHDSEGDAELHWTISQHLDNCPACAEWFARQSRFETMLCERLSTVPRDEQLWQGVLGRAGLSRPVAGRRWFLFSSIAACAAAVLLVVGSFGRHRFTDSSNPPSLSQLAAGWHEQWIAGKLHTPFESDSDLAVEDFLLREVSFPVRCPPRKDSGFAVQGAGTCRLANQPTAYVVGHVDDQPVSLFILSRESLSRFPRQHEELTRAAIHLCREGNQMMALSVIDQNLVLVVGQVSQDRLTRVLRAYGTYPHRS